MAQTKGNTHSFSTDSTIPLWNNGKQVKASHTFDLISPLTEQKLYTVAAASPDDALSAVAAAEAALPAWRKTQPSFRRDLLLRAAAEFEARREELWQFCKTETASTEPYFDFDFNDALESLKSCAGLIATVQGAVPTILDENRSAMVVPEPYGVVVSIAPWNAPCILGLRSFLGALASMFTMKSNVLPSESLITNPQWVIPSLSKAPRKLLVAIGH